MAAPVVESTAVPEAWAGFQGHGWRAEIDVREFVQDNYVPYLGDADFLAGPTERTTRLWARLEELFVEERRRGVLDVDATTPSSITAHAPGFIDREHELIVGLQTDAPLRRAIMPAGGLRMVESGLAAYGHELDPVVKEIFTRYRKTHNDGVFDAYTEEILRARRAGVITGLPDAYGRGRIWPSRCGLLPSYGRWRPPTVTTSRGPRARPGRRSSGCTTPTWPRPRNRTARPCPSAGSRRSWTSTCAVTSRQANCPRWTHRSWSTTS